MGIVARTEPASTVGQGVTGSKSVPTIPMSLDATINPRILQTVARMADSNVDLVNASKDKLLATEQLTVMINRTKPLSSALQRHVLRMDFVAVMVVAFINN